MDRLKLWASGWNPSHSLYWWEMALLIGMTSCGVMGASGQSVEAAPPPHVEADTVRVIHLGNATVYNGRWVTDTPWAWEMAYAWTEKCLGKKGDFSRVRFAIADSINTPASAAAGLWYMDGKGTHLIVYREDQLPSVDLIVHEMIHDIGGPGAGEWPTPYGEKPSKEFAKCLPSQRGAPTQAPKRDR